MSDSDILVLLKADLNISVSARDTMLTNLISVAKNRIATEGITFDADNIDDCSIVEQYAAYLYRARNEKAEMPRFLRWALNNRLMEEKANG